MLCSVPGAPCCRLCLRRCTPTDAKMSLPCIVVRCESNPPARCFAHSSPCRPVQPPHQTTPFLSLPPSSLLHWNPTNGIECTKTFPVRHMVFLPGKAGENATVKPQAWKHQWRNEFATMHMHANRIIGSISDEDALDCDIQGQHLGFG